MKSPSSFGPQNLGSERLPKSVSGARSILAKPVMVLIGGKFATVLMCKFQTVIEVDD